MANLATHSLLIKTAVKWENDLAVLDGMHVNARVVCTNCDLSK